ncbi:MAG: Caspase domain protein [Bacteroidetes bacterium ADurb.Bin408]|nr:MAG: Caspase domain protein [Bacteroidetes bacterium ADurb.Bin408]
MLRVKGKLIAKGTANDFIFFTRDGSDGTWSSIVIDNSNQTSELEFCKMSHAYHVDGDVPNSLASYGGLSVHYSTCNITNCIFTENKFWTLFPANATLNVTNCTFYDNYSYEIYNHVSDVVVKNTIMNTYSNSSGNTTIKYSLVKTKPTSSSNYTLSNNIYEKEPGFIDASGGNFKLSSSSPCKTKGENYVDLGVNFSASPSYTQSNNQDVAEVKDKPVQQQQQKQPDNNQNDGFVSDLLPILSIQEITLSKNLLNAEETAQLTITLKNIGAGDASGVYVNLSSDMAGLSFKQKNNFPTIAKGGGSQTINIDIKGGLELTTGEAVLKIEVVEPKFKVKIQGKQVKFPTREFQKPELIIAKFAVVENLSANPNNQIDINEQIDVKFAVQNVGQGNADNVSIAIANNQTGVLPLGVVDNAGNLVRKNPSFTSIPSGKYETITYMYFVNSEFTGTQLTFNITATERIGKYGFSVDKSVEINKVLQEEGFIRTVASNNNDAPVKGKIVIEDIPDFVSDVDQNIPAATGTNDKTFAVVIGNEVYAKEIQVKFALNDARIFKQYLTKTLGLPANNIHYAENATFGQILDALKWINDVAKAYKGQASIIFYYAGHGMPDEQTKSAFILPVDGSSQNTVTAVKLADVYAKLTEFPTASVTVFLDACFSGASRETNEQMLAQGRGVKINPKTENLSGNIVVFSAASGDETAFPYTEKQHGMFTYFLLKKLQESKGAATLGDLGSYIINNVSQQSIVVNKKSQTPQVNKSPEVENVWSTKKLKQ